VERPTVRSEMENHHVKCEVTGKGGVTTWTFDSHGRDSGKVSSAWKTNSEDSSSNMTVRAHQPIITTTEDAKVMCSGNMFHISKMYSHGSLWTALLRNISSS